MSFYDLIAHPARYNDRLIYIRGYLISNFGDLLLYPDKASYMGGRDSEALVLKRPFRIPENVMAQVNDGMYPVAVLAHYSFSPHPYPSPVTYLGVLYKIDKIIHAPRIPSGVKTRMHGITVIPSHH